MRRVLFVFSFLFLISNNAFANEHGLEPSSFTVWGILLPVGYFGIGGGIRGNWYLDKDGIADGVSDDIELDFGADMSIHFVYDWSYTLLTIPFGILWRFKLTDRIWLYPKVSLGYEFVVTRSSYSDNYILGGLYWEGAVGGFLKLNKSMMIRVEAGYPGLKAGLVFPLR